MSTMSNRIATVALATLLAASPLLAGGPAVEVGEWKSGPVTPRVMPAAPEGGATLTGSAPGVQHKICVKIFEATKKLLENLAARITKADSVDLNLNSCTMDDRHRMYIDMDGMVELKFDRQHPHIQAKMKEMLGEQLQTNGTVCFDFTITEVEPIADREFHVEFKLGMVLVLEEFLSKLVKFGANVVGTVTMVGIGNDLVSFVDGIDSEALAASLDEGFRGLTKVVMSLAGVEAYDSIRELNPNRQGDQQGGSVTGAVLAHLALSLLKGTVRVGLEVTGMSVGAAVGVALSPTVGATIGAAVGAAGFVLIGHVVHNKLTCDMPMKYRLARIKRLHKLRLESGNELKIAYYTGKIEKYEGKILKRVSLEMRTDRFTFLDEFMQQLSGTDPKEREALVPLWHKLQAKLRFEVVEHTDKLAQRMLDQLTATMEKH
ncbi:MAG: hypothetical protein HY303_09110 [Candidatus Wallbacteria bacterium]|nr:hypothetical protein [Candidatus Wallbacteria bacterium]